MYQELRERAKGSARPVVLVNACTHGHEVVGLDVIDALRSIQITKGTLLFSVANQRARKQGVAFIESDLNRSFSGNERGTYEEQIASAMMPALQASDIVIDIHSTNTITQDADRMLIMTKWDEGIEDIVRVLQPPRVLVMEINQNNALISGAKKGIAFEYGSNEKKTAQKVTHDIQKLLQNLEMIPAQSMMSFRPRSLRRAEKSREPARDDNQKEYLVSREKRPKVYRVFSPFPKTPNMVLEQGITNFRPIAKGDIVARKGGESIQAERDFVPILFGENRYTDIFGFMGEEISV